MVIEEYLEGPEISVLAFSDGFSIVPLPAAQDHKRIGEGDTGLNTGGMGAYAPAPVATPDVISRITNDALQPTIDGMRREGSPPVHILLSHSSMLFLRIPLRRDSIHRAHPYRVGTQSSRIQCPLWRSRNRSPNASSLRRHRSCCGPSCER